MKLLLFPLRAVWALFVILTPLLGVWVASTLAIYLNGPLWAACLVGGLLFPLLPFLWDARATSRFNKRQAARKDADKAPAQRWLTFWDRMTLRTLTINLMFLGALLMTFPAEGFTALSTRGDWMLSGSQTVRAQTAREVLFGAASKLEWLYELSRENPYERDDEGGKPAPTPEPNTNIPTLVEPSSDTDSPGAQKDRDVDTTIIDNTKINTGKDAPVIEPSDAKKPPTTPPREAGDPPAWPLPATVHPLVASMPEDVETSPKAVATYIAQREKDPFQRVKALHDYVASRIAYDVAILSLPNSQWPSQEAGAVFAARKGVCSGYALLLQELGRHSGDEIEYVTGDSRDLGGDVGGGGHAWNAAKIEGRWYLIDATWNAGHVDDKFNPSYGTRYLFSPPHIFGLDHFPERDAWQLREQPITRGEFMRQPVLKPNFFSDGFELISPKRSQVSVGSEAVVEVRKPSGKDIMANLVVKGQKGSSGKRCKINGRDKITVTCPIPSPGTYQVVLFGGKPGKSYPFMGQIEFVSR